MKFIYILAALTAAVAANPLKERGAPIGCSQCNPFPDGQPQCVETTSCVPRTDKTTGTLPTYCACRAGYKANPLEVGQDPAAQWRLPWAGQEGRVFVRPGVKCDTLCDHPELGKDGCQEVWLNTNAAC